MNVPLPHERPRVYQVAGVVAAYGITLPWLLFDPVEMITALLAVVAAFASGYLNGKVVESKKNLEELKRIREGVIQHHDPDE